MEPAHGSITRPQTARGPATRERTAPNLTGSGRTGCRHPAHPPQPASGKEDDDAAANASLRPPAKGSRRGRRVRRAWLGAGWRGAPPQRSAARSAPLLPPRPRRPSGRRSSAAPFAAARPGLPAPSCRPRTASGDELPLLGVSSLLLSARDTEMVPALVGCSTKRLFY